MATFVSSTTLDYALIQGMPNNVCGASWCYEFPFVVTAISASSESLPSSVTTIANFGTGNGGLLGSPAVASPIVLSSGTVNAQNVYFVSGGAAYFVVGSPFVTFAKPRYGVTSCALPITFSIASNPNPAPRSGVISMYMKGQDVYDWNFTQAGTEGLHRFSSPAPVCLMERLDKHMQRRCKPRAARRLTPGRRSRVHCRMPFPSVPTG